MNLLINLDAALLVALATAFVVIAVIAIDDMLDELATRRRIGRRLRAFRDQAHRG